MTASSQSVCLSVSFSSLLSTCNTRAATGGLRTTDPEALPAKSWRGRTEYPIAMSVLSRPFAGSQSTSVCQPGFTVLWRRKRKFSKHGMGELGGADDY
ncbi:hypothetical protein J3F83DRAFT_745516 [Trichoderma novae-zelandiae]